MEKAALLDGLSGSRYAQARSDRACPDECWRAPAALTGHAELRPWTHRADGHLGHLAMADEPAGRRSHARPFLATVAALAGAGFAQPSDRNRARPNADGRRPHPTCRHRPR